LLPNFICPGAQKSATTTLYDLLCQHPDVYLPDVKELHFFDNKENYSKGISWYLDKYFSNVRNEKIIGEITPEYMFFNYIPERMFHCLGKSIKFIFILRNPIDRAYSHYWMSYRRGYEKESFEKAIYLEKKRIKFGNRKEIMRFSYINRGFYSKQIKRFLNYFPKENMQFIIFEDFIRNTPNIMKQIFSFLEIDPLYSINYNIKSNYSTIPRSIILRNFIQQTPEIVKKTIKIIIPVKNVRMSIKTLFNKINQKEFKNPEINIELRKKLIAIYEKDIKELENIIEKDLNLWIHTKDTIKND